MAMELSKGNNMLIEIHPEKFVPAANWALDENNEILQQFAKIPYSLIKANIVLQRINFISFSCLITICSSCRKKIFCDNVFFEKLSSQTALADSGGHACIHFYGTAGVGGDSKILSSSPVNSAQIKFIVFSKQSKQE
jgi:hypothetical protein